MQKKRRISVVSVEEAQLGRDQGGLIGQPNAIEYIKSEGGIAGMKIEGMGRDMKEGSGKCQFRVIELGVMYGMDESRADDVLSMVKSKKNKTDGNVAYKERSGRTGCIVKSKEKIKGKGGKGRLGSSRKGIYIPHGSCSEKREQSCPIKRNKSKIELSQKEHAQNLPPINQYTLSELSTKRIFHNSKLRHEILFEPKLEFRPNYQGDLGTLKREQSNKYWSDIERALHVVYGRDCKVYESEDEEMEKAAIKIAVLLLELKAIIIGIVSDKSSTLESKELEEVIDKDILIQQLQNRTFDIGGFISTVSQIIEDISTPGAAAMVESIATSMQENKVCVALQTLLLSLEHIKIDIANSWIEMYRPYMKATAVTYGIKHFENSCISNTSNLAISKSWWLDAYNTHKSSTADLYAVFLLAYKELLRNSAPIPLIFHFDTQRIASFRYDLLRIQFCSAFSLSFNHFLSKKNLKTSISPLHQKHLIAAVEQTLDSFLSTPLPTSFPQTRDIVDKAHFDVLFSQLESSFFYNNKPIFDLASLVLLKDYLFKNTRASSAVRAIIDSRIDSSLSHFFNDSTSKAFDLFTPLHISCFNSQIYNLYSKLFFVAKHHWDVHKKFYACNIK
ncbi:Protein SOK1 [Zancudomyces culisetae]|uniref:Protein SOK1 n=1 Tax=Zancudomyces culisetae TaxID=1213189 RepID=A0A1R1PUP1_ZANCU|nr:Protein SOK1 [Zancudomyces culisetae]|eukprot:OMH84665.1 Protein SOK1 [Zancudomyces culisetae]